MKEYIITFKESGQISPDDWDVWNPTLKVNENTTIKEIDDFFRKNIQYKNRKLEVKLIELHQPSHLPGE